jgi:hypothetical protein
MSRDEHDLWLEQAAFYGFFRAIVADNKDPSKLGRVRLFAPGFLPDGEMSDWAWPMGMPFSGSHQRGGYFPPEINAQAFATFLLGDRRELVYCTGNWGLTKDNGGSGIPQEPESRTADEAPAVKAIQTKTFEVLIIDTETEQKLVFKTSQSGQGGFLEIDAKDGSVKISAKNWVIIEGAGVNIDGLVVNVKGRVVQGAASRYDI